MSRRILIFIPSLSSGGAERVFANMASYWAQRGYSITFLTLSDGDNDFYNLPSSVQQIRLGLLQKSANPFMGLVNNIHRVFDLRKVLVQTQPEIAIAAMTRANVLLSLATWGLPKVATIGSEHVYPPKMPLSHFWAFLRRFCYGHLSAVTALTIESKEWLLYNTRAKNVTVIPNAVPWPLPKQAPVLMPQDLDLNGQKLLLAVGRFVDQKGFDILIDAFRQIARQYANWNLVILGGGPLRGALFHQICQAGLKDRIMLAGPVGNLGDWYKAADLYVMSSRFEGFGNTLAEALAYGVPSVSFDCEFGPRDIVRHGKDGLLVSSGDLKALSEALADLMSNETKRLEFRANAEAGRNRFSIGKISRKWEALFAELLTTK